MCSTVQNLVTISNTVNEILPLLRFFDIQDGGRPPSWIFFNSNFYR